MNQFLQMLFQQKIKQIPQGMMNQLENQLKMRNPQAFQRYQEAKQQNKNPNEFLNEITNEFNSEQKQQWEQMMNGVNTNK